MVSIESVVHDSNYAYAQSAGKVIEKAKRYESINSSNYDERFREIHAAFETGDTEETLRLLNELEGEPNLSLCKKVYLYNYRGNIYSAADSFDDALIEYKKVLDLKGCASNSFQNQIVYVIAQLYFAQEKYNEALLYAKRWAKTQKQATADSYMLIGQAHYMLEEYDKALSYVLNGINLYAGQERVPKEGWLNLLNAIYRNTNQTDNMVPILEQLNQYYPKEVYRRRLLELKK